jgi:integration host factor subunit beta
MYRRDVERVVAAILNSIGGALERRDRVEVRGFGAFMVRKRTPRTGRNPKTGAVVAVPERGVPFFRPAKELQCGSIGSQPERGIERPPIERA